MPTNAPPAPREIAWLLDLIDQAYERKAWHGPNLRGSVRGLTPEVAAWRPDPERHSIAEQVLHAAYWKYAARRRLRGDKRGSFPLKGSNWFPVAEPLSAEGWESCVNELDAQHRQFRESVGEFPVRRLDESPGQSRFTYRALITGLAAHDIYHAGQIQLLKRLQRLS